MSNITKLENTFPMLETADLKSRADLLAAVILNISEVEAKRLSKLIEVCDFLEDKIFNCEEMNDLPVSELLDRYKLLRETILKSIDLVKVTSRTINWDDLDKSINSKELSKAIANKSGDEIQKLTQEAVQDAVKRLSGKFDT